MTYIAPHGWKSPTGIRTHNDRDVHPCTYLPCADINACNGMWHAIASGCCRNTIKSLHSALKTGSVRKRNATREPNLWEQCIRPDPTFPPTPTSSPIKMLCQTHLWKSSMQCIWLVASTVKGIPSSDLPQTTHVKQSGWYGLPVALSSWQKTCHQLTLPAQNTHKVSKVLQSACCSQQLTENRLWLLLTTLRLSARCYSFPDTLSSWQKTCHQ